jgi:alkaline phosphatase D
MRYAALLVILGGMLIAFTATAEETTVSPYDFPYGYPFPEYPLAGASHPSVSGDYMRQPPPPSNLGHRKRIGQYALRLIQTDRVEEAAAYCDDYLANYPGLMTQELLFMRALAHTHLGNLDAAAESMEMAINFASIPPQRFIAGPRRLFAPLHEHEVFEDLLAEHRLDLVHGPMLGAMTDSSVRIWVRTAEEMPVAVAVSERADMRGATVHGPISSRAEDDYTAEVAVTGLAPDTHYHYAVILDGGARTIQTVHQHFRTFPEAGEPARFQIAFGGCSGYVPPNERMWDTVLAAHPLAMLTLGDNVYIDDPESPDQNQYCYYQRQSRHEWRRLVGATPIFSIWDDHDFGMDDSWGGLEIDIPYWKPMVLEIFKQNWVNPSYGGGDEAPGVWYDFRIADVHFIMLDGRYYREDSGRRGGDGVENPTMLGPVQKAWLKETLTGSDAAIKVLVSPVSWHDGAKPGQGGLDTWKGFPEERAEIFGWIDEHEIDGIVLLSSDRHRSDAYRHEREEGYDFYEFGSGQFTNLHTHAIMEESLFGYNDLPSFGLLSFDTESDEPTVTYQIININGEVMEELVVRVGELR